LAQRNRRPPTNYYRLIIEDKFIFMEKGVPVVKGELTMEGEAFPLLDSKLISRTNLKKYNVKIVDVGEYLQVYCYQNSKFVVQKDLTDLELKKNKFSSFLEKENQKEKESKEFRIEDKNIIRSKLTCQRIAKANIDKWETFITLTFLNNFLVLSLLVNIYKAEKELPENKIDLYKKCFEYIAKKREEEKSKTGYNWKNIYPLMKDSTFINLSILAAPNNRDVERKQIETLLLNQYKTNIEMKRKQNVRLRNFWSFVLIEQNYLFRLL